MSPTIFQTKNLRVVIYPKDHSPPHVHVLGPDQEAKFKIEPIECFYSRGFSEQALRLIRNYLTEKQTNLMEAWNDYQK